MDDEHSDETFDEADIASLAEKLASLDLSGREQAALRALLADEVVGFAGRMDAGGLLGTQLTSLRSQGVQVFGARASSFGLEGVRADPGIAGTGGPRRL